MDAKAWPRDAHIEAAFRCRNGHVTDPAATKQCAACGVHDTRRRLDDHPTATRTLSVTGAGPGSPCRGDDGFFGRATSCRDSPSAARGRATPGPVASRASPSAVRPGAPPLFPRR